MTHLFYTAIGGAAATLLLIAAKWRESARLERMANNAKSPQIDLSGVKEAGRE